MAKQIIATGSYGSNMAPPPLSHYKQIGRTIWVTYSVITIITVNTMLDDE